MISQLRATSIERFFLHNDQPGFPNNIFCWLKFSGDLDQEAADRAVQRVAARHPMASMQVRHLTSNQWKWVTQPSQESLFQLRLGSDGQLRFPAIDPRKQNAACGWKIKTAQGWDIAFQSHHAAMDGLGGLQMISEWMTCYFEELQSTTDSTNRLRRLDPTRLEQRNHLDLLSRRQFARWYYQPLALVGAAKFLLRKIAPIVPLDANADSVPQVAPTQYPHLESRTIQPSNLKRLKVFATNKSVTLHAVLLKNMFVAIHQWRKEKKFHQKNERIRIMIPRSIRTTADRRLSAANRATLVQMDRTDRQFQDPDELLYWINHELQFVKEGRLEKSFLVFVRCFDLIPGMVRRMAHSARCRSTTAITNLGAPFDRLKLPRSDGKIKLGNLTLEEFDLVVPITPSTPAGFAVSQYAGTLKINLHYDPRLMSETQASSLMDCLVAFLMQDATSSAANTTADEA